MFSRKKQWELFCFLLVLAIELLMACQAIDLLRPLKSTEPLEAVHRLVRASIQFVKIKFDAPQRHAHLLPFVMSCACRR